VDLAGVLLANLRHRVALGPTRLCLPSGRSAAMSLKATAIVRWLFPGSYSSNIRCFTSQISRICRHRHVSFQLDSCSSDIDKLRVRAVPGWLVCLQWRKGCGQCRFDGSCDDIFSHDGLLKVYMWQKVNQRTCPSDCAAATPGSLVTSCSFGDVKIILATLDRLDDDTYFTKIAENARKSWHGESEHGWGTGLCRCWAGNDETLDVKCSVDASAVKLLI